MTCKKDKDLLQRKLEELYCCSCSGVCCNVATNICDCCVDPMQNLLNQLITLLPPTATIQVTLTTGATQSFLVSQVLSLENNLINIDNLTFIPICNISRVSWVDAAIIPQINLLPLTCTCGDCDCCERPLRERLRRLAPGTPISLQFLGQPIPGVDTQLLVQKIGLGVLIGVDPLTNAPSAYSICKITRVTLS